MSLNDDKIAVARESEYISLLVEIEPSEFIFLSRLLGDNFMDLFSIGIFKEKTVSVIPFVNPESKVTSTDLPVSMLSKTIASSQKPELNVSVKESVGRIVSSPKYLLSKFLKVNVFCSTK